MSRVRTRTTQERLMMTMSTTSPVGQIWTIEGLSEAPQMADFRKFPKFKAMFFYILTLTLSEGIFKSLLVL